jgi:plastocyanin
MKAIDYTLFGFLFLTSMILLGQSSTPAYSQYLYQSTPSHSSAIPSIPSAQGNMTTENVTIAAGAGSGGKNGTCVFVSNCFEPNFLTISQGNTVIWTNNDTSLHTITSGKPADHRTGILFDKFILPGNKISVTFNIPGTTNYYCKLHPWLTGQVIVTPTLKVSNPILTPLNQSKPGNLATYATCNDGLQMMFRTENNLPVCVTPQSAQALAKLGWGTITRSETQSTVPIASNMMKVGDTNFTINYDIRGGVVYAVNANQSAYTLILSIKTIGPGVLTLDIPRTLLDAKVAGQDFKFTVLNNGQEVTFIETNTTKSDRILAIPFDIDTQKIELIGNSIALGAGGINETQKGLGNTEQVILNNDVAGNIAGWKPISGATQFIIHDVQVSPNTSNIFVSVNEQTSNEETCAVNKIFVGGFEIICTSTPSIQSSLYYTVINLINTLIK